MSETCPHLQAVAAPRKHSAHPHVHGCEDCLKTGDDWVHLRLCLSCGHVGCCDNSPNQHATKHFHTTKHPVIKAFEPGEDWAWCFVDELMVDEIPAFKDESPQEHYASPAQGSTSRAS